MSSYPVVGVPADRRIIDPHPFHMAGEKYVTAIRDGAQGIPFVIPALGNSLDLDAVLDRLDGILLTGSPSNVAPHHYAGEPSANGTLHDPERDATSLPLIGKALEAGLPLFAICRGFQELNVVLGGTLHQRVHEVAGYHDHREDPAAPLEQRYGPAHEVHLVEGGLLRELAGAATVMVNSLHAQAVARLAEGVSVEAVADDGLIEAFRVDRVPGFALAVQWHPEWKVMENSFSRAMFRAFGDACRDYAGRR